MSNVFLQGLNLSLAGLGLTFAALGVLILAMVILERLFRSQPQNPVETVVVEKPTGSTHARDTEDEEIAAAIALALAHFRSLDICRSGLGTSLETGRGSWWVQGRAHHLEADLSPRHKPWPGNPTKEKIL